MKPLSSAPKSRVITISEMKSASTNGKAWKPKAGQKFVLSTNQGNLLARVDSTGRQLTVSSRSNGGIDLPTGMIQVDKVFREMTSLV